MALEYGLQNQAGFSLLTGEVGSGKTLLVRKLLGTLGRSYRVGLISNTNKSFSSLLPWICAAFELECHRKDPPELYELFVGFLAAEYAERRRVILIVDEAQNLSPVLLEELRVLSNVNADKNLVLQTILIGQPELRETLLQPGLRQFAQRIGSDFHLPALRVVDARLYVQHRLQMAGGPPDLISIAAIDLAWHFSRGIPRLINHLCDLSLVYAFGDGLPTVEFATMHAVVQDRQASGFWQPLAARVKAGPPTVEHEEHAQPGLP
jgi:type II secretory pathway predicted ATPase ExeA